MDLPDTKPELAKLREELIAALETANPQRRVEIQANLAEVKAKLKYVNNIAAAEAKRAADLRRAAGQAEARANLARHEGYQTRPLTYERDEDILIRAKMLHRELSRSGKDDKPAHFAALLGPLANFIEVQKERVKAAMSADAPSIPDDDPDWHKTWADK